MGMRHKLLGVLLALGLVVGCSTSPAETTSPAPFTNEPTMITTQESHVEAVKITLANNGYPWVLDDGTLDQLITLVCDLAATTDTSAEFVNVLAVVQDENPEVSLDNLVSLAGASLGSRCPEQGLRLGLG